MMQPGPVLILWQNPLFRETVQAILTEAGVPADAALASSLVNGELPAPVDAIHLIIAEGDQDAGYRILQAWKPQDDLQVLAFTMDDDRAHLWRYREWTGLTRRDIVRLLDGS